MPQSNAQQSGQRSGAFVVGPESWGIVRWRHFQELHLMHWRHDAGRASMGKKQEVGTPR
jgi:hypothetical protein